MYLCEGAFEFDALISQFVTEASKNCIARPAFPVVLLVSYTPFPCLTPAAPLSKGVYCFLLVAVSVVVVALPLRAV